VIKLIKTETSTYLPECECIRVDVGKCSWLLLQDRLLQVSHCATVINIDYKRPIGHVENPTKERDGADWVVCQ
jgi:hypothetical protein